MADLATVSEDGPAVTGNVLANDRDTGPDSDPLRVGGVVTGTGTPVDGVGLATPVAGSTGGTFVVQPNGSYTFDPGTAFDSLAPGEQRTTEVTYVIYDDNGGSATATLAFTVTGVNDAPTLIDPATGKPPLDPATASLLPPVSGKDGMPIKPVSVGAYFGDVDLSQGAPRLSVETTALPPGITFNPATGTFSGTPTRDASQGHTGTDPLGTYRVPVTATDTAGAKVTTYVTFAIANPAPVAVADGPIEVIESRSVTIAVLANDYDPDGDPIRIIAARSAQGAVTINPDGTLSFTPAGGFVGTAIVSYAITDDQGGTSTADIQVTVKAQNPVLLPPSPVLAAAQTPAPVIEPLHVQGAVVAAVNGMLGQSQTAGSFDAAFSVNGFEHQIIANVAGSVQTQGNMWTRGQDLGLGAAASLLSARSAVAQAVASVDQAWHPDEGLHAGHGFGSNFGSWGAESVSGFSLRFGEAVGRFAAVDGPRFMIESHIANGVLILTFEQIGDTKHGVVIDYHVTRVDGQALPAWLERPSIDILQGRRDPTSEVLDLRVTAILADGSQISQDVRVQTPTGGIQSLPRVRAELSPALFGDQFQTFAALSDQQSAALASAVAE